MIVWLTTLIETDDSEMYELADDEYYDGYFDGYEDGLDAYESDDYYDGADYYDSDDYDDEEEQDYDDDDHTYYATEEEDVSSGSFDDQEEHYFYDEEEASVVPEEWCETCVPSAAVRSDTSGVIVRDRRAFASPYMTEESSLSRLVQQLAITTPRSNINE